MHYSIKDSCKRHKKEALEFLNFGALGAPKWGGGGLFSHNTVAAVQVSPVSTGSLFLHSGAAYSVAN